jgi:hypothetical protein
MAYTEAWINQVARWLREKDGAFQAALDAQSPAMDLAAPLLFGAGSDDEEEEDEAKKRGQKRKRDDDDATADAEAKRARIEAEAIARDRVLTLFAPDRAGDVPQGPFVNLPRELQLHIIDAVISDARRNSILGLAMYVLRLTTTGLNRHIEREYTKRVLPDLGAGLAGSPTLVTLVLAAHANAPYTQKQRWLLGTLSEAIHAGHYVFVDYIANRGSRLFPSSEVILTDALMNMVWLCNGLRDPTGETLAWAGAYYFNERVQQIAHDEWRKRLHAIAMEVTYTYPLQQLLTSICQREVILPNLAWACRWLLAHGFYLRPRHVFGACASRAMWTAMETIFPVGRFMADFRATLHTPDSLVAIQWAKAGYDNSVEYLAFIRDLLDNKGVALADFGEDAMFLWDQLLAALTNTLKQHHPWQHDALVDYSNWLLGLYNHHDITALGTKMYTIFDLVDTELTLMYDYDWAGLNLVERFVADWLHNAHGQYSRNGTGLAMFCVMVNQSGNLDKDPAAVVTYDRCFFSGPHAMLNRGVIVGMWRAAYKVLRLDTIQRDHLVSIIGDLFWSTTIDGGAMLDEMLHTLRAEDVDDYDRVAVARALAMPFFAEMDKRARGPLTPADYDIYRARRVILDEQVARFKDRLRRVVAALHITLPESLFYSDDEDNDAMPSLPE